ncbi:MAG: zinc ribbon domain-containing protein, partial [Candidatus Heimdallarchaeota archaeon]|nr:zinc ribbon domain-containing protein [Candidatus Heimdallarchaeota archaeon]
MNDRKKYGQPGRKKKKINFLDKILGAAQKEAGIGVFIAIGEEESKDLRSGQKIIYGDSGLKVDSILTYTIGDYIAKIERELKKEVLEDEERSEKTEHLLFVTNIKVSLQSLGISKIKIQEINNELRLSFDSLNRNKYPFLLQFFIKYVQDGSIVLEGLFSKIQPFKVSIRSFGDEVKKQDQESFKNLNSHYIISSNDELLAKSLNQNSRITQKLMALSSNLELIMVNRKYFVVTFYEAIHFNKIVDLLGELYKEFVNQKTGLKTVTYIKCFDCGEDLDENDEKCPNCKANRPRCSICLLDLQPAEKEEVIQMPCCGV